MAEKCYAPVFPKANILVCFILAIIFALAIIALIILTLGFCFLSDSCRCAIKQYQYRISKCLAGNSDPNIPI